jgi:hypothetical protein
MSVPLPALSASCPARPDIVLIGAMKCATSTVSAWLEAHPDVHMVAGRDPDYFSRDEIWDQGPEAYGALFAGARPGQLLAENSNSYSWAALYPRTAERLAAACPGVRLVYLVRDPMERIVSHWIQARADRGAEVPDTPDRAVVEQPARFVDPSLYWRQLQVWRAHVPDARILIGFVEELEADPEVFFKGLAAFLEIAPQAAPRVVVNPSRGKALPGPLWSRLRALPGAGATARIMPARVKQSLRRALSIRPREKPRLSAPVFRELSTHIDPDSAAFLAHTARPPDFWRRNRL